MTSREFCYWLQGYFEILDPSGEAKGFPLGPGQADCIRKHLQTVFKHEVPPTPTPVSLPSVPPPGIVWTGGTVSVFPDVQVC